MPSARDKNSGFFRSSVFLFLCLFVVLALAGCGLKRETQSAKAPADGGFYYQNKKLGFALTLPPEFSHYQTQMKKTPDFTDIEFFVPTADRNYRQEVPGYGKPIIVRIFAKEAWESLTKTEKEEKYAKTAEKNGKVYAIEFWQSVPEDWQAKWTNDMKEKILELFETK